MFTRIWGFERGCIVNTLDIDRLTLELPSTIAGDPRVMALEIVAGVGAAGGLLGAGDVPTVRLQVSARTGERRPACVTEPELTAAFSTAAFAATATCACCVTGAAAAGAGVDADGADSSAGAGRS